MIRIFAALAVFAAPAAAQEFSLPAGCDGLVTMQKVNCRVSHYYTCDAQPGMLSRVDFDQEGMTYLSTIDSETRWMEAFYPSNGVTETLVEQAQDHASFTTLLAEGYDDWEFEIASSNGTITRYVGNDTLTGNVIEVDGVALQETVFEMRAFDTGGQELFWMSGQEYVNAEWRTFVSGQRRMVSDGVETEFDASVRAFIFPGEPGFLEPRALHGCGDVISQAETLEDVVRAALRP